VKRLALVLFVCLALPANAATASFVHLHTDVAHNSDHHDGRQVHRHAQSPEADDHTSQHDSGGRRGSPDGDAAVEPGAALWFLVPASLAAARPADATSHLLPAPSSPLAWTMDSAATPLEWPPPNLTNSADVRPLNPRGPPR